MSSESFDPRKFRTFIKKLHTIEIVHFRSIYKNYLHFERTGWGSSNGDRQRPIIWGLLENERGGEKMPTCNHISKRDDVFIGTFARCADL